MENADTVPYVLVYTWWASKPFNMVSMECWGRSIFEAVVFSGGTKVSASDARWLGDLCDTGAFGIACEVSRSCILEIRESM